MKFKNINPNGAVDVPELGLVDVAPGSEVEATGTVAESMQKQDTWQRVDKPKTKES